MSEEITADIKFSIIPEWLLDSGCSDKALRLYAVLARYADNDRLTAYPGRTTLAKRMGCHRATVDRAIQELEELGAITKRQRVKDGKYQSSLYTIRRIEPRRTDAATPVAPVQPPPSHPCSKELEPKNYNQKAAAGKGASAPRTDSGDRDSEPGRNLSSERSAGKSKVNSSERAITDSSYAARLFDELGENAPDLDPERAADNYMTLFVAAKKAGKDADKVAIGLALGLLVRTFGPLPGQARGLVARLVKANGPTAVVQAAVTTAGSSVGLDVKWADDPLGPVRYMAGVVRGKR